MIPWSCDFDPSSALSPAYALEPFCDQGSVIMYVRASFWTSPCNSPILMYWCKSWTIKKASVQFSSVAQSHPTLQPHEPQHARPSCPSPTPRVHSNSYPSSRWCHLAISSSVVPFSSCPQSLPASGSFLMSQLFAWGGQSIGVSAFSTVYCDPHKGFGIVNKAEIDVFLELSCFFDDPADVDNLISGSSAFSKTSLNIWKFTVHVLLKPGLENFEHYFTSMWDECNCAVVWAFFGIAFLWDWNENWPFPVL